MTQHPVKTPEMTVALMRQGLDVALCQIAARLEAVSAGLEMLAFDVPDASALPHLMRMFTLSAEEAELLCLAVGCELDAGLSAQVKAVNGSGLVDVALADRMFGAGVWDMLCPEAPLRRWRLVELVGSGPLHQRHIRPDERIVQAMLGVTYRDARLEGMLTRIEVYQGHADIARDEGTTTSVARVVNQRLIARHPSGRDRSIRQAQRCGAGGAYCRVRSLSPRCVRHSKRLDPTCGFGNSGWS